MIPIVIISNNPSNFDYCGNLFLYLSNQNYDTSIDSDFNDTVENKLKYYQKYFIIKVNDKDINIIYNNKDTVLQKNNPEISDQLEKLINIHL